MLTLSKAAKMALLVRAVKEIHDQQPFPFTFTLHEVFLGESNKEVRDLSTTQIVLESKGWVASMAEDDIWLREMKRFAEALVAQLNTYPSPPKELKGSSFGPAEDKGIRAIISFDW